MDQTVHVCAGTCHAIVSQEDYEKGITRCGTEGCTCQGMEFEEAVKCGHCGKIYKKDEKHEH